MMIEVKLRKVISVMAGKRSLVFRLYRGGIKMPWRHFRKAGPGTSGKQAGAFPYRSSGADY
jgi:hypothetical protein